MQQENLEHEFQFLNYLIFVNHTFEIFINFDYGNKFLKYYD